MSGKPLASVVIPTCNRVEELRNLLASTLAQTVSVEIHVMDDGDKNATAEMIHREFPQVRYHRLGTGRGPAFQRNRGIELSSCDIVFPVDDDTLFVSKNTVEQTLSEFCDNRIGAVGIPYINVRQDRTVQQRAPESKGIYLTFAFVGAAHAVRRDVFLKVGGFREHFFIMGEESDLCLRMMSVGYVTRLGHADPIHHIESPRRDLPRMDYYGRRNDILFAWHNVPMPYFPIHLIGTTVNGIASAIRARRFQKMLEGMACGYIDWFRWWTKRRPVPREIYRLQRSLKKTGPVLLSDVERLLPGLDAEFDEFQPTKVPAP